MYLEHMTERALRKGQIFNMDPLISMIVPVFNAEKYIENFINLCSNQEYSNLEIVFIDDGSTDNTLQFIKKACDDFNNIRVYSQKNKGPSSARNYGLKCAIGEFVIFADVDDYIYPDYVSHLYYVIDKENADIAFCNYKKVVNISNEITKSRKLLEDQIISFDKIKAIKDFNYRRHLTGYSCLKLIKKEILDGIFFPEEIVYGEDFVFTYELLKKTDKIAYSNRICYLYWQNINSSTHIKRDNTQKYQDAWKAHMNYLEDIERRFPEILDGAIAKCYLLAINDVTRVYDIARDRMFTKELYSFIRHNAKRVMKDKESKNIVKLLGLSGMVSAKVTCNICKFIFWFMEKSNLTFSRTV